MYFFPRSLFFNDTATTEIYTYGLTLSLLDARPIWAAQCRGDHAIAAAPGRGIKKRAGRRQMADLSVNFAGIRAPNPFWLASAPPTDKRSESTRLNSSH